MESYFDFQKVNISKNQEGKWLFMQKQYRREGQARKACFNEWQRRKRLNLPMEVKI